MSSKIWWIFTSVWFVRPVFCWLVASLIATVLSVKVSDGELIDGSSFQELHLSGHQDRKRNYESSLMQDKTGTYSDFPQDRVRTVRCWPRQYTGDALKAIINPVVERQVSKSSPQSSATVRTSLSMDVRGKWIPDPIVAAKYRRTLRAAFRWSIVKLCRRRKSNQIGNIKCCGVETDN